MVPTSLRVIALVVTVVCTGQPAKSQPKSGAPASGVFTGRSGKPMANMRLILAEVTGDQELTYAKIKLAVSPPTAVTDDKASFNLPVWLLECTPFFSRRHQVRKRCPLKSASRRSLRWLGHPCPCFGTCRLAIPARPTQIVYGAKRLLS